MGVYVNSTVVTLDSTEYTLAGYAPGEVPTDYGKKRTTHTPVTKPSTGYTKITKPTTPYNDV
jgi:hypothetical protein